jgi:putative MATE family efflux protein
MSKSAAPAIPAQNRADLPLAKLAVPMYLESLLRTLLSSADVAMLAFFAQTAVAAVGLVNLYNFFLMLMYQIVAAGASVLVAQYLGAGRDEEAGRTVLASFILATLFSLVLSLGMAGGAGAILSLYDLEPEVRLYAVQYLTITGAGSVFVAFNIVQAAALRCYGHAKSAMMSNMAANVVNVLGNAVAIFGPFGLPKTGVVGVALSTVAGQAVACLILAFHMRRLKDIRLPWRSAAVLPSGLYRRLLSIGAPIAGEGISYNVGQILVTWMVSAFGTAALSANTYAVTLLRFVFMPALAIGNAGQIKTGYLVGAGRAGEAKAKVWRYYAAAFVLTLAIMSGLYSVRRPLLGFFTRDPAIAAAAATILLISFARETGRVANIVVIPALKGSGDILFPVFAGAVVMWGVGVGGAWLLGVRLGLGLAGVWIAIAADEWVRSLLMAARWQSGAWRGKSLVRGAAADAPAADAAADA